MQPLHRRVVGEASGLDDVEVPLVVVGGASLDVLGHGACTLTRKPPGERLRTTGATEECAPSEARGSPPNFALTHRVSPINPCVHSLNPNSLLAHFSRLFALFSILDAASGAGPPAARGLRVLRGGAQRGHPRERGDAGGRGGGPQGRHRPAASIGCAQGHLHPQPVPGGLAPQSARILRLPRAPP